MGNALIDALLVNDSDRLAKLLAAGENPDPPFEPGFSYTPLDTAADLLHRDGGGATGASIDAVILLLRYGADVNRWDEPRTAIPILTAAQIPHSECARILLAAGANPNVADEEGNTPLRLFTIEENREMVRLLLQCGANMYRAGGMDGMNSISLAATRLNVDLVRLFLAHGADPLVPDNDRMTVLDHLRWFPSISEPETPEKLERFHEIRRLLGGA